MKSTALCVIFFCSLLYGASADTLAEYRGKLDAFFNSSRGNSLVKGLSYIHQHGDALGSYNGSNLEKEGLEVDGQAMHQLQEFQKSHPALINIVEQVRHAVHEVFEVTTKAHVGYIKERIVENIKEKYDISDEEIEQRSNVGGLSYMETTENTIEVRNNAMALDNTLKMLKALKEGLTKMEFSELLKDPKRLAEKLIRDDIEMDEEEFLATHAGLSEEAKILSEYGAASFIQHAESASIATTVHSSDRCSATSRECDRRQNSNSCEARIEVQDQKGAGTCFIFASLGAIELDHCMHTGRDEVYSKQQAFDCLATCNMTCASGGNFHDIVTYLNTHNHVSDAQDYKYTAVKGTCNTSGANIWTGTFDTAGAATTTPEHSNMSRTEWVQNVKKLVVKHGAVTMLVNSHLLRYNAGRATRICDTLMATNHMVIVTGWTYVGGVESWIIRNSWGHWWAELGYAYVAIVNNCQPNYYPLPASSTKYVETFSDAVANPTPVRTRIFLPGQEKQLYKQIRRGQTGSLQCTGGKLIKIVKAKVTSYAHHTAQYATCTDIPVYKDCDGQSSCNISFPPDKCEPTFDDFNIAYTCSDSVTVVRCEKTDKVGYYIRESCMKNCYIMQSFCGSDLTCIQKQLPSDQCDLSNVMTEIKGSGSPSTPVPAIVQPHVPTTPTPIPSRPNRRPTPTPTPTPTTYPPRRQPTPTPTPTPTTYPPRRQPDSRPTPYTYPPRRQPDSRPAPYTYPPRPQPDSRPTPYTYPPRPNRYPDRRPTPYTYPPRRDVDGNRYIRRVVPGEQRVVRKIYVPKKKGIDCNQVRSMSTDNTCYTQCMTYRNLCTDFPCMTRYMNTRACMLPV